jgi:ABC-type polysaccharide/polyol phosphate transport system ATPase subunit
VLRSVSTQIAAGESVAVLGLKNSGRTEFVRLAAGTLIPDEGSVRRREPVLPMVDLGRAFDRGFTVRQNIYLLGGLLGMTPARVEGALSQIVETAGITSNIDKYMGRASAMFRQKLAWTIAMSTQAKTFAVDEMLVVGDPEFRERCFEQIKILKAAGTTFLVATEVPRKFEGFFDRAIVLHDGGVVADSSFADGLALLRELRLANSITDTAETKSDPKARPESEDGF